jgi:hypothetical protein
LAYEQVLGDYPDCPVAKIAKNRLVGLDGDQRRLAEWQKILKYER